MKALMTYSFVLLTSFFFVGACNNPEKKTEQATENPLWAMGIALYSFHHDSFISALEKADSAEVKLVEGFSFHKLGDEFDNASMSDLSVDGVEKIKQLLSARGMSMKSMYVGNVDDEEGWKYYFDLASKMGMTYLVSEPPLEQLDMLDSLAGAYDVKIALHEHAKGKSIYWHPDSVLAAIQDRPNIGACADLGHWVRSGLDPVECLAKLENHILGVHLKDAAEFGNLTGSFVTVGTGVIDFPAVIAELKRQHFEGLIHVECEHHTEDNLQYVKQDLKTFNELTSQSL